jgi:hypothetical protein
VSASRRDGGGRIVGSGSKRLRQGIGVLACGVIFGGAAGHAAAQGPIRPQPARPPAHPSIRPDPAPAARGSIATSTTVSAPPTSTRVSTPTVTSTPPVSAPASATRTSHTVHRQPHARSTATPSAPARHARPLRSLAFWASRGEALATSAAGPSSGTSYLLLFVGLALVLLTIGEATFLRRAARASKPERRTNEQLAVHRVQLRR